jgi:hypothetical protein
MSIKIYTAYRLPIAHLNELFTSIRPQIFKQASERIIQLMDALKQSAVDVWMKENSYEVGKRQTERKARYLYIIDRIKEGAKSPRRTILYDIEYSLNVWIKGRYAYVIPIDNMGYTVELPEYAVDYAYWNNTDRPSSVTAREWVNRYKTWNDICLGTGTASHNACRMTHNVISFLTDYSTIDACMTIEPIIFGEYVF